MTWVEKAKISQESPDEEIRTPDNLQILVGASSDLVLLWQIAFSNWSVKEKEAAGDWDLKEKIVS